MRGVQVFRGMKCREAPCETGNVSITPVKARRDRSDPGLQRHRKLDLWNGQANVSRGRSTNAGCLAVFGYVDRQYDLTKHFPDPHRTLVPDPGSRIPAASIFQTRNQGINLDGPNMSELWIEVKKNPAVSLSVTRATPWSLAPNCNPEFCTCILFSL